MDKSWQGTVFGLIFMLVICYMIVTIYVGIHNSNDGLGTTITAPIFTPWGDGKTVPMEFNVRYRWKANGTVQVLWAKGIVVGAKKAEKP